MQETHWSQGQDTAAIIKAANTPGAYARSESDSIIIDGPVAEADDHGITIGMGVGHTVRFDRARSVSVRTPTL